MKMTKNYKKIYKIYYQWLFICRKNIIIFKLSMAYNIGIANFARTCKGQLYEVHPPSEVLAKVNPTFVDLLFKKKIKALTNVIEENNKVFNVFNENRDFL